jgi:hypothetical protein
VIFLAAKPGNASRECTKKIGIVCHTQKQVSWSGLIPRVYPHQTNTFTRKTYLYQVQGQLREYFRESTEMHVSSQPRQQSIEGLRDQTNTFTKEKKNSINTKENSGNRYKGTDRGRI